MRRSEEARGVPGGAGSEPGVAGPGDDLRVRVGALALHGVAWGRVGDPAVLLVHGYGGHARWWAPLVPALLPGRRLVAVDLRGHGESDWPETLDYRIESMGDDLCGVIESLELGRVALIGHSMGGRCAAWLAARHPERVRGTALLDAGLRLPTRGNFEAWREKLAGERRGRSYPSHRAALAAFRLVPDEPGVPPATLAQLAHHAVQERGPGDFCFRFDRGVLLAGGDGAGDLTPLLADVEAPLWIAHGRGSQVLAGEEAPRLRAALPRARVESLPGAHHFFLSHPEPAAAWLDAFLRAVGPGAAGL